MLRHSHRLWDTRMFLVALWAVYSYCLSWFREKLSVASLNLTILVAVEVSWNRSRSSERFAVSRNCTQLPYYISSNIYSEVKYYWYFLKAWYFLYSIAGVSKHGTWGSNRGEALEHGSSYVKWASGLKKYAINILKKGFIDTFAFTDHHMEEV